MRYQAVLASPDCSWPPGGIGSCTGIQALYLLPQVIGQVEKVGLTVRNKVVLFDRAKVLEAGVSAPDADVFENTVETVNRMIAQGSVKVKDTPDGWRNFDYIGRLPQPVLFQVEIANTEYKCEVEYGWLGTYYKLNKAATQKLAEIISATGDIAAILAALAALGIITAVEAPAFALAAALLKIGADGLKLLDMCKGVTIVQFWGGSFAAYPNL
jgi:hypothetical protein